MAENNLLNYIKDVLENMPADWLNLTTHRLDIYNEDQAKTEFLDAFLNLYRENNSGASALNALPTAFDYIRLGHPLSSILEWAIADLNQLASQNVISFSSATMPVMAVLRKNLLDGTNTRVLHTGELPSSFDPETLRNIYGYSFELKRIDYEENIKEFNGSTVLITQQDIGKIERMSHVDFYVNVVSPLGSIILVDGQKNEQYIPEIQHVRRRETIAMTPANCFAALKRLTGMPSTEKQGDREADKSSVLQSIKTITDTNTKALVGSSGLSVQYAIVMGLIDHAMKEHEGKDIKIAIPPNCYGGTNDQARRVAACIDNVEIVDLPVDREHNMVQSIDLVLDEIAKEDAIPYIIAEIPTNPRVEVPDLDKLREVLSDERTTSQGDPAVEPVFILDQTFCPNVPFLGEDEMLSNVRTISYVSGSKFPSGGLCTAGYCVANEKAEPLIEKIEKHMRLCDNEATDHQMEILSRQLPSMKQRIHEAFLNTKAFVHFIRETLPEARINFVSDDLPEQGFTPSVFSLDLPTKGDTHEERELYKRDLNLKLIQMMIKEIPHESKFCVSYGQLKGSYWTIPATSTQGTTREDDKDYIVRVALSPDMDLELHKKVFSEFVEKTLRPELQSSQIE